jgi:hypothetical protein
MTLSRVQFRISMLRRGRTLSVPSLSVLLFDEVHQRIVDPYTVWEPETSTRRNFIEEP